MGARLLASARGQPRARSQQLLVWACTCVRESEKASEGEGASRREVVPGEGLWVLEGVAAKSRHERASGAGGGGGAGAAGRRADAWGVAAIARASLVGGLCRHLCIHQHHAHLGAHKAEWGGAAVGAAAHATATGPLLSALTAPPTHLHTLLPRPPLTLSSVISCSSRLLLVSVGASRTCELDTTNVQTCRRGGGQEGAPVWHPLGSGLPTPCTRTRTTHSAHC